MSGKFDIDPEIFGAQVEWGHNVIRSRNNPSHDFGSNF